ncbi:MAG: glycosyltransferase [Phycisphaerales bacterium]|nr:MAG: glycosyltransferase [Phycisphaerales bacterium]
MIDRSQDGVARTSDLSDPAAGGVGRVVRMDMHCHSRASDKPVVAALGVIDCPECYSEPERVYEQARTRGMDFVTITDHDTIRGALELHERGFERFVIGEEVTVYFPEDRCKLHVLVWGLTPAQHEEIGSLGLRNDVYQFAHWLVEHNLPHSLAHPLYIQNGRLTIEHIERAALLFKAFETLNGAHSGSHRSVLERWMGTLTPARVRHLSEKHGVEPLWPRVWDKGVTAGSDDHALLNVGRTWTEVRCDGEAVVAPQDFLRRVMSCRSGVGGGAGRSDLLAHQLTAVGVRFYAEAFHDRASARGKLIGSKLGRFAGVEMDRPGKPALALDALKKKLTGDSSRGLPIVDALRSELGPVLDKYPDLKACLDPETWADEGPPISQHARMADFSDDLGAALGRAMAGGAMRSLRERDKVGLVDHLISYAIVQAARLPYIISLFHQNKERVMLERIEHQAAESGGGPSVLERPMRVSLFTDTLGDVNGVCRFIQNAAAQANATGRDLRVVTSTTLPTPDWGNIYNFEPVFSTKMPKYEHLELVLPPLMKILRHLDEHQPDVIHISTPGPVGMIGFLAAKMLRVPVLGVYHTDFPAYIDRLFDDVGMTRTTEWFMRAFYEPFRAIFTRSQDYVESLTTMGMQREKIVALMPGVETSAFHIRHRDPGVWSRFGGVDPAAVKVLYVGRVSVEKNLPMLTQVWKRVHWRLRETGRNAQLIVVGDGPYRAQMEQELEGCAAAFLGFRHAEELSKLYASSDFYVFPSTTDTLGQVVMESQASGLPVIVTDKGGPKEVVDHGLTGYVLPHDDHDEWVARILELITDEKMRKGMGRAAHTRMQRYTIDASFEHFWSAHVNAWHEHLATLGIKQRGDEEGSGEPALTPARV